MRAARALLVLVLAAAMSGGPGSSEAAPRRLSAACVEIRPLRRIHVDDAWQVGPCVAIASARRASGWAITFTTARGVLFRFGPLRLAYRDEVNGRSTYFFDDMAIGLSPWLIDIPAWGGSCRLENVHYRVKQIRCSVASGGGGVEAVGILTEDPWPNP